MTVLVSAACTERGNGTSSGVLLESRDSAGIPLVEVAWAELAEPDQPRNSDPDRVVVETAFDGMGVPFFEIVGVVSAGQGRWVVGQKSPPYLTLIDTSTVYNTGGRQGEGPGEFRRLDWLGRTEEGHIAAFSVLDGKLVWFDGMLNYLYEYGLARDSLAGMSLLAYPHMIGFTRTGNLVARSRVVAADAEWLPLGVSRPRWRVILLDSRGTPQYVWAEVMGDEVAALQGPYPDSRVPEPDPPLKKQTVIRTSRDRLYVLDTATGLIEVRNRAREVERRFLFAPLSEEPTAAQIDAALAPRLNAAPAQLRSTIETNLRRIVSPGPPAVLRTFLVDQLGRILFWFDPVSLPAARGVFARIDPRTGEGERFVGPDDFTPLGVEGGAVWGITRDTLDVEQMTILRLP